MVTGNGAGGGVLFVVICSFENGKVILETICNSRGRNNMKRRTKTSIYNSHERTWEHSLWPSFSLYATYLRVFGIYKTDRTCVVSL